MPLRLIKRRNRTLQYRVFCSGYEGQILEPAADRTVLDVDLVEIPLLQTGVDGLGAEALALLRDARPMTKARNQILAALLPWAPLEPATPVIGGGKRMLQLRLNIGGCN